MDNNNNNHNNNSNKNNYIFDSHCHIQNSSIVDSDRNTIRNELVMPKTYTMDVTHKIKRLPVRGVGMMATTLPDTLRIADIVLEYHRMGNGKEEGKPDEPQPLAELPSVEPEIYYGFGIHPWFCEATLQHYPDWKEQLEQLVRQYPKATIGECGLDKVARNRVTRKPFSMATQVEFFEFQFQLAAKYHRPLIIHSVKTVGKIFEYLRGQLQLQQSPDHFPPKIMFHSYCGSPDITKSLLGLSAIRDRLYFGFSYAVNSRIQHNEANLKLIPLNRILWETDYHEIDDVPEFMDKLHEMFRSFPCLASVEDLFRLTYDNAKEFFNF